MKNLKILSIIVFTLFIITNVSMAKKHNEKPLIQMAILLDTSGSMQGLIEQTKTQLWKIVNEMALAKQKNKSPRLEVAIYEYGKSSIPASEGYMRMIVPLSEDLDQISDELFKLRTNGGSEYCGQVIQKSVENLKWNRKNNVLKVIFIAGNEPFTQGRVDYRMSCKNAISKGIIVNTIFCGNYQTGIRTNWKDGADLADGKYMNIDHNQRIIHIKAPQDKEIVKLGMELNKTYIGYGKAGSIKKERQKKQDMNAMTVNEEVMVQRSVTKSSKQYSNTGWDLVDAVKEGKIKVEDMKHEELPSEMKKLNKKERKGYIDKKRREREEIQKRINELKKDRDIYVSEKRKKIIDDNTIDTAMIKAIREQAEKKNFKFKK